MRPAQVLDRQAAPRDTGVMEALRYLGLSLALGLIATWASENLFWFIPPPGISLVDWLITWVAYSVCAGAALSMVLASGAGGWPAAFWGGAVAGYLLEGVVVGTIYDAFPVQIVWTPIAWHALVMGGGIVGIGLSTQGIGRRAAIWTAAGVALTGWGLFWPLEPGREALPGFGALFVYLVVPGALAAVALWLIGRIPRPRPHAAVLLIAPGLALLVAAWMAVSDPRPQRAVLPVVLILIWFALRRSGPRPWAAPLPLVRHLPLVILPLIPAIAAPLLWAWIGPVDTSNGYAWVLSLCGLAAVAAMLWRRPVRPAPPAPPAGR